MSALYENPTGAQMIIDERSRQIEKEGWSSAHDDGHDMGELAEAAISYACLAIAQVMGEPKADYVNNHENWSQWPFDAEWWKPSHDPILNLTKAGALIAAEIDRLQRKVV